jgi:hypothetical protein
LFISERGAALDTATNGLQFRFWLRQVLVINPAALYP